MVVARYARASAILHATAVRRDLPRGCHPAADGSFGAGWAGGATVGPPRRIAAHQPA